MKRLVWLMLLLSSFTLASVPITIQGTIVDASNNIAVSGYIQFDITPLNQGLAYQVLPSTVIAGSSKCAINPFGQPVNFTTGVAPCLVWPNDVILPSNTLYTITIAPANHVSRVYNNVALKSTVDPQSLAQLTFIQPQPVVGTVIGGSPLVTMAVVPNLDLVWSLGDPQHRYIHVYANTLDNLLTNLTVDQLHVTGFIDNPTFGQPLLLQDDVHITGELSLDNCITYNTVGPFTDRLCPATGASFTHQLPATNGFLAPIDSPGFSGVPTAPTPAPASNDTTIATTAFVQGFVAPTSPVTSVFGRTGAIVAVTNDYTVAQVNGAAPINNPIFTGDPQAPTPSTVDNDTSVATTAYVKANFTACPACALTKIQAFSFCASGCTKVGTPCSTGSGGYNSCTNTITWTLAFASTSYVASCTGFNPLNTHGSPGLDAELFVTSQTTTTVTLTTVNVVGEGNGVNFARINCIGVAP
jgi:hypothetical protein